jgi:hypothetical protein
MKLHGSHELGAPPAEQNSCVVFDMPIESRMYLPAGLGCPLLSSGLMSPAAANPARRWAAGIELEPPG